jgi:cytochrome c-type biogenesis protein CcmH
MSNGMVFWTLLAAMCLAGAAFVGWPFYRKSARRSGLGAAVLIFVLGSSVGLYAYLGNPGVTSGPGQLPDVGGVVEALAKRLQTRPDDLQGWKMLGRSYTTLGNYAGAVAAYERALEIESPQSAQTLSELGEALVARDGQQLTPESLSLFENALALEPSNSAALFWGGIGAFRRDDLNLAADRWELLLATNPPPQIREMLQQRVAEWRGEPIPATEPSATVVRARVEVSDSAIAALPMDATVFVIARDPAQPSPPIVVVRRRLSELPLVVELGDRESMIANRTLSTFSEFELIARVSISGQPTAQSGDWFGSVQVRLADADSVVVAIDRQVP